MLEDQFKTKRVESLNSEGPVRSKKSERKKNWAKKQDQLQPSVIDHSTKANCETGDYVIDPYSRNDHDLWENVSYYL